MVKTTDAPAPALAHLVAGPGDGLYHDNACRVPWRLAIGCIARHGPRVKAATQEMTH